MNYNIIYYTPVSVDNNYKILKSNPEESGRGEKKKKVKANGKN